MKSAHPFDYNLLSSSSKRPRGGTPGVPMVINQNPRMDTTFSDALAARLCREYTEEAIQTLVEHMRDTSNPAVSLAATNVILDRGYGKAREVKMLSDAADSGASKYKIKIEFVENNTPSSKAEE